MGKDISHLVGLIKEAKVALERKDNIQALEYLAEFARYSA